MANIILEVGTINNFNVIEQTDDKTANALITAHLGGKEMSAVVEEAQSGFGSGVLFEQDACGQGTEFEFDGNEVLAGEMKEVAMEGCVLVFV